MFFKILRIMFFQIAVRIGSYEDIQLFIIYKYSSFSIINKSKDREWKVTHIRNPSSAFF
jgi:hypothetical protein